MWPTVRLRKSNVAENGGADITELSPEPPISLCCFVDVCAALRANKIKSCLIGGIGSCGGEKRDKCCRPRLWIELATLTLHVSDHIRRSFGQLSE